MQISKQQMADCSNPCWHGKWTIWTQSTKKTSVRLVTRRGSQSAKTPNSWKQKQQFAKNRGCHMTKGRKDQVNNKGWKWTKGGRSSQKAAQARRLCPKIWQPARWRYQLRNWKPFISVVSWCDCKGRAQSLFYIVEYLKQTLWGCL